MSEPDFVYNPNDWEVTYLWSDRDHLAEEAEIEHAGIERFKTLIQGPDRFCAWIGNKYCWFESRAEAEAAWKADQSPQEGAVPHD